MLAVHPNSFAYCTDNLTGVPSAALVGTTFASGANDTDAAAVEVIPALSHDVHYLSFGVGGAAANAANGNAVMDILLDPAGGSSWSELISDVEIGMTHIVGGNQSIGLWYHFPLWIPAGASIGVQAKTAHTANLAACRIVMSAFGEPSRPDMWWCGQKVETLGVSSNYGTAITPGNGSYGSWTNVGSTTSHRYGSLQLGIGGSDTDALSVGYYFQVGSSSAKIPGTPTIGAIFRTAEDSAKFNCMPTWVNVPAGTQMQVRAIGSTVPEDINVALYGVF